MTITCEPLSESQVIDGVTFHRLLMREQYDGDMVGSSEGIMLMVETPVEGSVSGVAMMRFVGTVHGRTGSFILQQSGFTRRGFGGSKVPIVPDTGTGELNDIDGRRECQSTPEELVYRYSVVYSLPPD